MVVEVDGFVAISPEGAKFVEVDSVFITREVGVTEMFGNARVVVDLGGNVSFAGLSDGVGLVSYKFVTFGSTAWDAF